jgi:hypothetical protein
LYSSSDINGSSLQPPSKSANTETKSTKRIFIRVPTDAQNRGRWQGAIGGDEVVPNVTVPSEVHVGCARSGILTFRRLAQLFREIRRHGNAN